MPRPIVPPLSRYRRRRVPGPWYLPHTLVRLPATTLRFLLPVPLPQAAVTSPPVPSAPRAAAAAPPVAVERGGLISQRLPRFLDPLDIPLRFLQLTLIPGGESSALAFFQVAQVGDGRLQTAGVARGVAFGPLGGYGCFACGKTCRQ